MYLINRTQMRRGGSSVKISWDRKNFAVEIFFLQNIIFETTSAMRHWCISYYRNFTSLLASFCNVEWKEIHYPQNTLNRILNKKSNKVELLPVLLNQENTCKGISFYVLLYVKEWRCGSEKSVFEEQLLYKFVTADWTSARMSHSSPSQPHPFEVSKQNSCKWQNQMDRYTF